MKLLELIATIHFNRMGDNDAVNEEDLILCCGLCCSNCSILPNLSCCGCSGKLGFCCLNAEVCCTPGAPCLFPLGCVGLKCENDGCSIINGQLQCCCIVCSAALPCNEEVPIVLSVAGLTLYPKCGCCIKQGVSSDQSQMISTGNCTPLTTYHFEYNYFDRRLWSVNLGRLVS